MDYDEFVFDKPTDTINGYRIWYRDLMSIIMLIGGILIMCSAFIIAAKLSESGYTWMAYVVWPIMVISGSVMASTGLICCDETYDEKRDGYKAESRKQFYYFMSTIGDIYNPKDVERPMPENV